MGTVRRGGVLLDIDSSVSPTHGEQEMSVWADRRAAAAA